ncbi:Translin [Staphylotrichum tortipilum]|uniref:Translin n=1 Tax=Staphylotrichum tortipilum TaxID=2831512 RepID=A0AAN6MER9_9PEZI|nr:Translin [Staphylotrichum longicolle]
MALPMIDPALFDQIKTQIEQDTVIRKQLDQILDDLNQQVSFTQGLLTRIHSTPRSKYAPLLSQLEAGIKQEIETVGKLSAFASQYPYYKYNHKWTRTIQDAVATVILCAWLGGMSTDATPGEVGRLLTLEDIGQTFNVPVNLKDSDAFHITIEEYLLGLISVIDDLSRLAVNSVTLGDTAMAVRISGFIKDLHAGFQVLNLKNDILRKRVDSIKYAVKKVEDVVYDLSLRNLIPTQEGQASAASTTKPAPPYALRPVQIRQTPLAQAARHALPALLAGVFIVRFRALVADPVSAMASTLPVTAALQVAYAVLCLPVAGGSAAARKQKPRPGDGGKKRGAGEGAAGSAVVTALLSLLLTLLVSPFLYAAMVLFGAPFLTHGAHTFLCAAHLAVLALFPLFYVHGVDGAAWAAVGGFGAPLDETFGGLVGGTLGAWLGAVPIPLDWDRDWQRWPVTILCGLYGGYVLGRVIGGTLAWGKRF